MELDFKIKHWIHDHLPELFYDWKYIPKLQPAGAI